MTASILDLLHAERQTTLARITALSNAIAALSGEKRRGRPKGSKNGQSNGHVDMMNVNPIAAIHNKRVRSDAVRKAQSLRMTALWKKRKAAAKGK